MQNKQMQHIIAHALDGRMTIPRTHQFAKIYTREPMWLVADEIDVRDVAFHGPFCLTIDLGTDKIFYDCFLNIYSDVRTLHLRSATLKRLALWFYGSLLPRIGKIIVEVPAECEVTAPDIELQRINYGQ